MGSPSAKVGAMQVTERNQRAAAGQATTSCSLMSPRPLSGHRCPGLTKGEGKTVDGGPVAGEMAVGFTHVSEKVPATVTISGCTPPGVLTQGRLPGP